jgi:hypothetical protein
MGFNYLLTFIAFCIPELTCGGMAFYLVFKLPIIFTIVSMKWYVISTLFMSAYNFIIFFVELATSVHEFFAWFKSYFVQTSDAAVAQGVYFKGIASIAKNITESVSKAMTE